MLTVVQDLMMQLIPSKRKRTTNGWLSFNAQCCTHNGETQDKRGRGGILANGDGSISYHCFNCNFKTTFVPGQHLSYKFRKLLQWYGASDNDIKRLVLETMRLKDLINPTQYRDMIINLPPKEEISFKPRPLPDNSLLYSDVTTFDKDFTDQLLYLDQRKVNMQKYNFYYSTDRKRNMNRRVIIPFYWKDEIIGYTARIIDPVSNTKYINEHDHGYVFNVNNQLGTSKFVVVVEGPMCAMSIDGVAVLCDTINEQQVDLIDSLQREVIVVPDFDMTDSKWSGANLINCALEYNWAVSFPIWAETCKDVNEAVCRYGKLFVLDSILKSKETNKLRIELMKKKWAC